MTESVAVRPPSIGEDIKQRKPFRTRSQEVSLGLLRAADDLKRRTTAVIEAAGITIQQYNVLRILRGVGSEGLPTLTIGERMLERTPGVTRLIDRMETKGWVVRKRCAEDRRRVWCAITNEGLALIDPLDNPVNAMDDSLLGPLNATELATLADYLDRIRAHANK
jgi:DNA-binding MarR family transcriptional regulator